MKTTPYPDSCFNGALEKNLLPAFKPGTRLLFQGDSITDMARGRNESDRTHRPQLAAGSQHPSGMVAVSRQETGPAGVMPSGETAKRKAMISTPAARARSSSAA